MSENELAQVGRLTEEEFAARVGVSARQLQRYRQKKRIPFCKVGTRVYYLERHVAEFFEIFERRPKERRAA